MIVRGIKPVENRTWWSAYRGRLYIHASKTWDREGAKWIVSRHPERTDFLRFLYHSRYLQGYIIGHVNMIDCVQEHPSEWFVGPYGFVFENPHEYWRELAVPCKGHLGIWKYEGEVP